MSATIEERLARYTTELDQAVSDYATRAAGLPLPAPERPRRRGPGRRLIAVGVAACIVAVLAFAISSVHSDGNVNVSTVSSVRTAGRVTSPPPTVTPSTGSTTAPKASTSVPAIGTKRVVYQPFTANGIDPRLRVTARLTGTCIRMPAGGRDYYRCFATTAGIYDPCFAGPHGTADPLVCPSDPTTATVVALTATSVTSDPPSGSTRPWALQLATGQVCEFVSAAWGGLGPYGCATSGHAPHGVADCRQPTPDHPWWTTACQKRLTAASAFVSNRVVEVWF